MKEQDNILKKAVESLKNSQVPPGPSDELTEETLEKLDSRSTQPKTLEFDKPAYFAGKKPAIKSLARFAAAAVFLIIAGYAAGRLASPETPDMQEIQAALEPAIRAKLLGEMEQYVQAGLESSYVQLKDDLTEQYRRDFYQLAANIVTASGSVTNQLLEELIESINAAQTQDRQRFTAALEQIEFNRRQDKAQFSNALVNFALLTEDELQQTKQDMVELFRYARPESNVPNEF